MAEQIDSNRVLDKDAVGSVHRETAFERFIDRLPTGHMVVAVLGTVATWALCAAVLFSESDALKEIGAGGVRSQDVGCEIGPVGGSEDDHICA